MKSYIFKTLLLLFAFMPLTSNTAPIQLGTFGNQLMTIIMPKNIDSSLTFSIPSIYVKSDNTLAIPFAVDIYDMKGEIVFQLETTNFFITFPDLAIPDGNYQLIGRLGDMTFKRTLTLDN